MLKRLWRKFMGKRKLKVYVASKFENKDVVRSVHRLLRDLGHEVTMDWTIHDAGSRRGLELAVFLQMCAHQDEKGVRDAHVLFLIDHPACKGAYTELGIAIGTNKHIIIVGGVDSPRPGMKQNIFHHKQSVKHVALIADGIAHVERIARA